MSLSYLDSPGGSLSDPRIAAFVDLVAFGETPSAARDLMAKAEDSPGRTFSGEYAMIAHDIEPGSPPYSVARIADA